CLLTRCNVGGHDLDARFVVTRRADATNKQAFCTDELPSARRVGRSNTSTCGKSKFAQHRVESRAFHHDQSRRNGEVTRKHLGMCVSECFDSTGSVEWEHANSCRYGTLCSRRRLCVHCLRPLRRRRENCTREKCTHAGVFHYERVCAATPGHRPRLR